VIFNLELEPIVVKFIVLSGGVMHTNPVGSSIPSLPLFLFVLLLFILFSPPVFSLEDNSFGSPYTGSEVCRDCHPVEYLNFVTYAKKSHSFHSIERLKEGLSASEIEQCYSCHTTGYGKPGGFVSLEKTPHLKNAGCEVCHGPGAEHVRRQDAGSIKTKLTKEDCEECHISERVKAFRFKPLIHGGAH
jgi:hypothetical protein